MMSYKWKKTEDIGACWVLLKQLGCNVFVQRIFGSDLTCCSNIKVLPVFMVKFHVKKNDIEFLLELPLDTSIDEITETAANISNQILKLQRMCSLLPDLIKYGPFRTEEYRV